MSKSNPVRLWRFGRTGALIFTQKWPNRAKTGVPKNSKKIMRSTVRCFGDPKDTIDSEQLKNQIYLLRFGHTRALLLKKKGHEMAISPVLGKLTHMWEFLWNSWSTIIKPNIQGLHCQLMRWIVWGRFLEAGMKAWWDKVRKAPLTQSFTSPFSVQTAQAVKRSSDLLHKKRRWITS